MKAELGNSYSDKITGFKGVAIGRVEYITGCNQVLLSPKVAEDGSIRSAEWFDEQRMVAVDAEKITLDNGSTPGCALAAPKI